MEVLVTVDIYDVVAGTEHEGPVRVARKGEKLFSVTLEGASLVEVAAGLDRLVRAVKAQGWHID